MMYKAAFAQMGQFHALYVSDDDQLLRILQTEEAPVPVVILVKLITVCVIVFHGHRGCLAARYRGIDIVIVVPSPSFEAASMVPL